MSPRAAEPKRIHNGAMAVTLSIKNVPDSLARQLRKRAARNHRSLQGELMAILSEAVAEPLTVQEFMKRIRALNFSTPDESVAMIRETRDAGR